MTTEGKQRAAFRGTLLELKDMLLPLGIQGRWTPQPNGVWKLRCENDAGLLWSMTRGTLWYDGPIGLRDELEAKVTAAVVQRRPPLPLRIGEYRAETAHLTAAQHGAYLLLIMEYWQAGLLPQDDEALARIAAMPSAEWRRARPVIEPLFGPGWRHKRMDIDLVNASRR
jgi:hypothetical protein